MFSGDAQQGKLLFFHFIYVFKLLPGLLIGSPLSNRHLIPMVQVVQERQDKCLIVSLHSLVLEII